MRILNRSLPIFIRSSSLCCVARQTCRIIGTEKNYNTIFEKCGTSADFAGPRDIWWKCGTVLPNAGRLTPMQLSSQMPLFLQKQQYSPNSSHQRRPSVVRPVGLRMLSAPHHGQTGLSCWRLHWQPGPTVRVFFQQRQNIWWGADAQWLERTTDDRVVTDSNPPLRPLGNFGNFLYPTLPVSFRRHPKAVFPFYLVSMSGEVKYPTQRVNE